MRYASIVAGVLFNDSSHTSIYLRETVYNIRFNSLQNELKKFVSSGDSVLKDSVVWEVKVVKPTGEFQTFVYECNQ